ncbi:hypothetical protein HPP92_003958 [Vanilla planifolia]|uniref:Mechanosensitive ion channel protein n=1 Tax=Vanilla planifolia TaxID=51239 RepID=A0A835S4M2_VANPL|nr:hypothetical protein HPP92_003958 [Vanilla planifolia]
MDSQTECKPKQPEEVMVLIAEKESAAASSYSSKDAKLEPLLEPCKAEGKSHGPEISNPAGLGAKKPPRPSQSESFVRRRSITESKSRFEEPFNNINASHAYVQELPWSSPYRGSPNQRTPRTVADEEEEEDEEELYRIDQPRERAKHRKKCGIWLLVEWLILIFATSCLITSLLVHRLQGYVIWGLQIWRWCLMVMVICCGRLVTHWLITVLVFLIEMNFLFRKKVLYFVYGLQRSVQVFMWLGLILLSWLLIFNDKDVHRSKKTARALNYVTRALAALLIGSVIWLLKTILIKMLASSFHMNRFFDRIQESLYHQYLLRVLSGPPVMEMAEKIGPSQSSSQLSFRNLVKGNGSGKFEQLEEIDFAKLHYMSQKKVSAWTMRSLVNIIRSSGLTTISKGIDESFDDDMAEQRDQEITNEQEARDAAYQIFRNVAKPGFKYIDVEDLMRFLSKEEVKYVLPLFAGASKVGKIKKSSLRNWVVKAYLDRQSLALSLKDTKTAVDELHKLLSVIVVIIVIIIMLLLMGFATTKVLVFISSQLLLLGFIFTSSCKTAFEAIIFVFVMHPYDVGDRCVIDGVQMVVEEMNILSTVFLQSDNTKIYYPNSILATKPIRNFYRSPHMGDSVEFSVDISTSMDCIATLKARIRTYIDSKPNHWHQNFSIVIKDIVNVNTMNMVLYVTHTMNFQNITEKNSRRTDLILELKKNFEELSIRYNLLPQVVHLSYIGHNPMPMEVSYS